MNAEAEQEMLESQLERAAKENAALTARLHIALVCSLGLQLWCLLLWILPTLQSLYKLLSL